MAVAAARPAARAECASGSWLGCWGPLRPYRRRPNTSADPASCLGVLESAQALSFETCILTLPGWLMGSARQQAHLCAPSQAACFPDRDFAASISFNAACRHVPRGPTDSCSAEAAPGGARVQAG